MERNYLKNGLVNLLILLVVGAAGLAMARYTQSLSGQIAMVYVGLGFLVTAVSCFQMRLEERERLEKMEFDELTKSPSRAALFTSAEGESFLARRSREQFERFFVPVFTVILFLLQGGGAFLLWRWLKPAEVLTAGKRAAAAEAPGLNFPLVAMALFGLFALVLFLLGKYSANIARLQQQRLLRPGASYLQLNAYLCAAVAIALAVAEAGVKSVDLYTACALAVLLALLAVETLISLVLEIYRPRIKGKVERSLYESRLVGLLGHPEGLITTAAQALDYQFGFKVSETWFYRFLESALGWILLAQVGVLVISTCFVVIQAGEEGLLERLGEPVKGREVIGAGVHLKMPWPIDKVYRYRTEQIQTVTIGSAEDADHEKEKAKTIVWAVTHSKEDNFLVASHDQPLAAPTQEGAPKKSPPVSFLSVSIPVQFQIRDLVTWAYHNENPAELLEKIAAREVVRYLVSVDLNEVMSRNRWEAAETLRERIQSSANERKLGVRIIFVGLKDIHPPVKVAKDYENVVSALHTREARILAAQADGIRTNALAGARAFTIVNEAEAERQQRQVNALAQAALFTNQIPSFQAARSVYAQRAYLQTFVRAVANARKYVVVATNTQDVVIFNLEDKIRAGLEDAVVPAPKTK